MSLWSDKTYPDINDVSHFVHFHVRGKWNSSMCAESSGEQIPSTTSVTLGVRHVLACKNTNNILINHLKTRGPNYYERYCDTNKLYYILSQLIISN